MSKKTTFINALLIIFGPILSSFIIPFAPILGGFLVFYAGLFNKIDSQYYPEFYTIILFFAGFIPLLFTSFVTYYTQASILFFFLYFIALFFQEF